MREGDTVNFYKRHIGDYLKKTAHLSLLEHGIYNRLLDVYYTLEGGIPKGQAARLIGARSAIEKKALDGVLAEFFELFDGHWTQSRCDQEIAAATEKAERNREVGKKGGRPPGNGNGSKPKNNPDGFHIEPIDNPSQTPDSSNQTPVTNTERGAPPLAAARSKPKKSSAMPEGTPTEHMRQWTTENCPGVDFDKEIQLLRDHEFRSPRSKWDAVIRTWMTRAMQFGGKQVNGSKHITKFDRMMADLNGGSRG